MIKLNLGCGWRNFGKEWKHIDGGEYPHLNSKDITNLPYNDNSVDLIYASHVLEYFDRQEAIELLYEWRRALKPDGQLQLAVPDFKALVNLYNKGYPIEEIEGTLFGRMYMGDKLIYHKTSYDFNSLSGLLKSLDFKDIKLFKSDYKDYSQAVKPKLYGDKYLISLNMECTK